jgi:hypothetical protein
VKFTQVENVPCWAAIYFVTGELSGYSEEDLKLIREYEDKLKREGLRLVCPIEGTRNEFCATPAFGLACDVEDWEAEVLPPDRIVFRKYWHAYDERWTPIAFIVDAPTSHPNFVLSYEHIGQHCEACMSYYRSTKPCEPELYAPLLKELESIGYRVRAVKHITRRRK